ncbi:MAG TPA: ubiquitin [Firmicutes bacterium]|nr:ubiquitin [Bacillota bacterium]
MATLEQAEKLRQKAGVSYEDAKAALDATGDDLLEALIWLEKKGKTAPPPSGGYYSSRSQEEEIQPRRENVKAGKENKGDGFWDFLGKLFRFLAKLFHIGNTNYLVAHKRDEELFACPITVLVFLLIIGFWFVVPLMLVSLFFGFRYSFRGKEFGKETVNKFMESATETAEGIKKKFQDEMER